MSVKKKRPVKRHKPCPDCGAKILPTSWAREEHRKNSRACFISHQRREAEEHKEVHGNKSGQVRKCTYCDGEFLVHASSLQKFCSSWCGKDADKERLDKFNADRSAKAAKNRKDMVCSYCRGKFTPPRSDAKYCSNACKQEVYWQRKTKAKAYRQGKALAKKKKKKTKKKKAKR